MSESGQRNQYSPSDLPPVLRDFVVHNTQDALIGLVGLIIAEVNEPLIELLGYCRREELVGRSIAEFTTAETFQLMQSRAALRMAGVQRPESQVYSIIRKDGSQLLIDTSVLPWPENPVFAVAIVRDVTEKEDELRNLQKRERLYRSLAETIPAGIVMEDALGRFIYANEHMSLLTGYSVEEILRGAPIIEHPPESGAVKPWGAVRNTFAGSDQTVLLVRKDGSKIWTSASWRPLVDEKGNVQGAITTFIDITQRVKAEEAIKESEAVLRSFLDALKHPASLSDRYGRLLLANETLARGFGLDVENAVGINLFPLLPETIRELRKRVFRKVVETGEPAEFEDERDGRTFMHYLNPVPGSDGEVKSVAWIAIDITERKRVETALRKEEKWSRTLVENIPGAVIRRLICSQPPIIDFVSQAIEQLTGWPQVRFVGKPTAVLEDIILPEDRDAAVDAITEAIDKRQPFVIAYRIRRRDGSIAVCRERGQPIADELDNLVYVDSIVFDITDLHQAEQALRESEEKYRSMVENSQDLIMLCTPAGEITYLSSNIESMLGYKPEELPRLTLDIIHADDRPLVIEAMKRGFAGESAVDFEYRFVTRSGQIKWVSHSWSPIIRDGKVHLIVNVIRDVTEKRLAEDQLRRSHDQLQKAYNLQQEFLNNVTHEVRTPLTAIKGYAEMLLEEFAGPLSEQQRALVKKVEGAADSLIDLVGSLLETARLRSGTVELCPKASKPGDLASKAIGMVMPTATQKGLTIDFRINGPDKMGVYDTEKVGMILNNLLSNAVKFTDRGQVELQVTSTDSGFEVIVSDTGPGISAKELPQIFEPFRQLQPAEYARRHKAPGFGLGLSIVHSLVEVLGGSLVVSSKKGIGTAFTLYIPSIQTDLELDGNTALVEST